MPFEGFQATAVEVDWAAGISGPPPYGDRDREWQLQVAPAEGGIAGANAGTRPATCQCCCDADMFVVPPAFARSVAKLGPLLPVRHMPMAANL